MEKIRASGSHAVGYNMHHLQWCTKYRYKMFEREAFQKIADSAIREIATMHKIEIRELFVMPEHVHVSAELPPTMSQSEALRLLKGGSSRIIFQRLPNFALRYPR